MFHYCDHREAGSSSRILKMFSSLSDYVKDARAVAVGVPFWLEVLEEFAT